MLLTKAKPRPQKNTKAVVEAKSMPAPIAGLNYRDPISQMRPQYALVLDNVICRPGYVEVRKGRQNTATGFSATVETLMPYNRVDGTRFLFAAAGTGIFDATASGAIGAAVVGGRTSAYFYHVQYSTAAGNYLICGNGVDNAKIFDGAVWADLGATVVVLNTITHVSVWKHRLWLVQKNTMAAWYLPTDAIAGAAVKFDFAGVFTRGGNLLAVIPWTIDSGVGPDDYLLAISSMGEVAVYKGTDPAAASTFALVGVYYVSPPIGRRFYAKIGGDVVLLTQQGLVSFSRFFQSTQVDARNFISDNINQLLSQDIASYGSTQGWEVVVYLEDNFLLIQVPSGGVGSRYQYVMSTITKGWSRFLVSPAVTWAISGGVLYHGQTALVANSWTGGLDVDTGIAYTVIPAFSYFKDMREKLFTLARLTINTDQPPALKTALLRNFDQAYTLPAVFVKPPLGSVWDVALWDVALWSGLSVVYAKWYSLPGLAYAATQVIRGTSVGSVFQLIALDYVYQPGELL
jgi:hypothetical protein